MHFITIAIISLSIPSRGIGSINVIDVSLFQVFAARTEFTTHTAVLPAHKGKADERYRNRDRGETQEDEESTKFRLWKFDIDVMLNQEGFTKKDHFFRIPGQFKK